MKLQLSNIKVRRPLLLIIFAEFLFVLSSVLVKLLYKLYEIQAAQAGFFRFALGLTLIIIYMLVTQERVQPKNKKAIVGRAVFNTIAVFFYYAAFSMTSITKANVLNMTYPIFIAALAPFILKEKTTFQRSLLVLLAFTGIYLVLNPDFNSINRGDLSALVSGFASALSIMSLRSARKTDSVLNILFFLMLVGFIGNSFFIHSFVFPSVYAVVLLFVCAALSFFGQLSLTLGYHSVTALEGSITSNTRILFAGLLGVMFFKEHLTFQLLLGALLIVSATICIKRKEN